MWIDPAGKLNILMTSMEAKQNSHLKKVLKSYQLTAANTMSGPGPNSTRGDNGFTFHRHSSSDPGPSVKIHAINNTHVRSKHLSGESKHVPLLIRSVTHSGTSSSNSSSSFLSGNLRGSGGGNGLIVNIKRENLDERNSQQSLQNLPVTIRLPPQFPPPPILSEPDRSGGCEKRETIFEGEYLSCFSYGGEDRLCFPEVITVLRNASGGLFLLPQINQVCDELQIFCSLCSSEQLEVLKLTKVIPMSAPSCGLIRKTDAERLVNSMLYQNPPKAAIALNMVTSASGRASSSSTSVISKFHLGRSYGQSASHFRVYHECFGVSEGIVMPQLYEKPDSLCIECLECHGLLSPSRFVSHSHHGHENRTCHWGFDSANWRNYLLLEEDQGDRDRCEAALREFKARFQNQKRKDVLMAPKETVNDQVVIKRIRYSDPVSPTFSVTSPTGLSEKFLPSKKRLIFTEQPKVEPEKELDVDVVKQLVADRMDKNGAEIVNRLIDSMAKKISSLQTNCVCKTHEKVLKDKDPPEEKISMRRQPSVESKPERKVNTMDIEIGSLKKQLLRRHEQLEDI